MSEVDDAVIKDQRRLLEEMKAALELEQAEHAKTRQTAAEQIGKSELARIAAERAMALSAKRQLEVETDAGGAVMKLSIETVQARNELQKKLAEVTAERDLLLLVPENRLDGYRELGSKCAALEAERDDARAWVRKMQAGNVTTCAWCGLAYPPGTATHGVDELREHVKVCEKHPVRALEAERDDARERLKKLMRLIEGGPGFMGIESDEPIPMLLWCPACHAQHIDAPEPESGWTNPPHRTHKCKACSHLWAPANLWTEGVAELVAPGERTPGARLTPMPQRFANLQAIHKAATREMHKQEKEIAHLRKLLFWAYQLERIAEDPAHVNYVEVEVDGAPSRWEAEDTVAPDCPPLDLERKAPTLHQQLDAMTDDERICTLRSLMCLHCGRLEPGCQCWNDE